MHGIGNDFVMVDAVASNPLAGLDAAELARRVNDRRHGVGGDGLIVVDRPSAEAFRMRMFNPDGSESEMCGNGVRCVARLLFEHGHLSGEAVSLDTGAGRLRLDLLPGHKVRVDMGPARLTRGEIGMTGPPGESVIDQPITIDERGRPVGKPPTSLPGTAVGMGNPHWVLFVDDAQSVPLNVWGPMLERHPEFPNRVNVHFVQVVDRRTLVQRTWERGAGATLACGTGACACAVAGALTGRSEREVTVQLPGGELEIAYASDGHVFMTGPAETVFEGTWPWRGLTGPERNT